MITLPAQAVSSSLRLQGEYSLLSIHDKAINLINEDGVLFSLHPNVHYMSSFGLTLRRDDYDFVKSLFHTITDVIVDISGTIKVGHVSIIPAVRKLTLAVKKNSELCCVPSCFFLPEKGNNGFGYTNHVMLKETLPPIDKLVEFLQKPNVMTAKCVVDKIGTGQGLTPSFDDALVGVLAVIYLSGKEDKYIPMIIEALQQIDINMQTTSISKSFIEDAVKGDVSYPLYRLILAFNKDINRKQFEINQFIKHGHTSGLDTLLGIGLAFEYIQ
ncbi:DUF2877 domain-containing protein [Photobacterium sp.]|uniref:DUF2877 domain-containing protein n=1 Tax=Photobacterium sp. TaxID=660 RepID=UPI00299D95C5|nr:DUF2877 domain-containing protein [Photobacterium sp.]MDX1301455.1 DUF2877 domain-containing protein [Photobacterium sp.]